MGTLLELVVSLLNISSGQVAEAIDAELGDGKAGYCGAVDNRLPQHLGGELVYLIKIAEEAPGKAITGPGGVLELVNGIGWGDKVVIAAKHDRSILPSLYDHRFGTHIEYASGGSKDVLALGKQSGL